MSYDGLNRLVQVAEGVPPPQGGVPVPVEDYAYDQEGNRLSLHLSAAYQTFTGKPGAVQSGRLCRTS